MDFRLKVFYAVAKNLSFTKAARELFISQPAVSKNIRELEMQYKVALFERSDRRIRLTEAGRWLFQHVGLIQDAYLRIEENMNRFAGYTSGEIALGASTTIAQYVLPPLLSAFIRKYPDIKLSLLNGNSAEIEQALRDERISLGLVEGNARQTDLRYVHFMDDELVAVVRADSDLALRDEITPAELRRIPVVLRENGSGTLDVLEEAQTAFEEANKRRAEARGALEIGAVKAARAATEAAYTRLIDVVNAAAIIHGEAAYKNFIEAMNGQIVRAKAIVKARRTRSANEKEETPAPETGEEANV